MQAHGVRQLIHGHTHRPAIHRLVLSSGEARRIVLGDWYQTDSVLVLDERGPTLTRVADVVGTQRASCRNLKQYFRMTLGNLQERLCRALGLAPTLLPLF